MDTTDWFVNTFYIYTVTKKIKIEPTGSSPIGGYSGAAGYAVAVSIDGFIYVTGYANGSLNNQPNTGS